jgi:excinuclease UvrABC nuclease subunit
MARVVLVQNTAMHDKICGVYGLFCADGVYVGSSVDVLGRIQAHLSKLRRGAHHSYRLQSAWDDGQSMTFALLERTTDLLAVEQTWMDMFSPLLNVLPRAGSGSVPNSVIRERLSKAAKQRFRDPDEIEKNRKRAVAQFSDPSAKKALLDQLAKARLSPQPPKTQEQLEMVRALGRANKGAKRSPYAYNHS